MSEQRTNFAQPTPPVKPTTDLSNPRNGCGLCGSWRYDVFGCQYKCKDYDRGGGTWNQQGNLRMLFCVAVRAGKESVVECFRVIRPLHVLLRKTIRHPLS